LLVHFVIYSHNHALTVIVDEFRTKLAAENLFHENTSLDQLVFIIDGVDSLLAFCVV